MAQVAPLKLDTVSGVITRMGADTVPPANLGTGTPDSTKFLRGDGAWSNTLTGDFVVSGSVGIGGVAAPANSGLYALGPIRANFSMEAQAYGLNVYYDSGWKRRDATNYQAIFFTQSTGITLQVGTPGTAGGAAIVADLLFMTGNTLTVGGVTTGQRFVSTVAIGTAPFTVTSTTLVPNLYVARAVLADSATTNANLTGPITSVGNATAIASQTGTGTTFVMSAAPTITGLLTASGDLTVQGNTTLGNAVTDALTIASNTVTWSGNPTHSGNHYFNGDVSIRGATMVGDNPADAFYVWSNAVTWFSNPTHSGTHTFSGGSLSFSNGTSNMLIWNTGGLAAPTYTTRSAGTKLVLYPSLSGSAVDYAIGVESGVVWFSSTTGVFKFYTNAVASATIINGQLSLTATTGTAPLVVASTTLVANLNATYVGGIPESYIPWGNNTYKCQSHGGSLTPLQIFMTNWSGFWETYSVGDLPAGTGHVHGFSVAHINPNGYGIQVCGQYSQGGTLFTRGVQAGTPSAWYRIHSDRDYGVETAYTPVLTAVGGGSFGSTNCIGHYSQIGYKTYLVTVECEITNVGTATAANYHTISLPFTASSTKNQALVGREVALTGQMLTGVIYAGGTIIQIFRYDNNPPVSTVNAKYTMSGVIYAA